MKKSARMFLPFLVLLLVVLGCTKLGRQPTEKMNEQYRVAKELNAKFSLRNRLEFSSKGAVVEYDCKFNFEVQDEDNKITLVARFCESTSSATKERKLTEVLTPENVAMIKNAGFEQVKLYERVTDKLVDTVDVR
jgi:hypothetical protein